MTDPGKGFHDSVDRWKRVFLPRLKDFIVAGGFSGENLAFVYGDTHDGGWGEYEDEVHGKIRMFNTGGWVVHNQKSHPACHLFAVDEEGNEYILDVSLDGVMSGGETLLSIAEKDVEHRYKTTNGLFRMAADLLF